MNEKRENALANLLKHGWAKVGPNVGIDAATAVTLCEDGVAEFVPNGSGGHYLQLVEGICIHGCPPEDECRFCISLAEEEIEEPPSPSVQVCKSCGDGFSEPDPNCPDCGGRGEVYG